nr:hypothetical protein Iba_chr14cCG0860 [Ipomoea batatas]
MQLSPSPLKELSAAYSLLLLPKPRGCSSAEVARGVNGFMGMRCQSIMAMFLESCASRKVSPKCIALPTWLSQDKFLSSTVTVRNNNELSWCGNTCSGVGSIANHHTNTLLLNVLPFVLEKIEKPHER